jgi:hypothetical protein
VKLSTQQAIVICVSVVTVSALVFGLAVYAHMDNAALIGLIAALGSTCGVLVVQLRSNQKLTDQDRTLDKIVKQTNGASSDERQDIAERAVAAYVKTKEEQ